MGAIDHTNLVFLKPEIEKREDIIKVMKIQEKKLLGVQRQQSQF
jgi:hypothetical protein